MHQIFLMWTNVCSFPHNHMIPFLPSLPPSLPLSFPFSLSSLPPSLFSLLSPPLPSCPMFYRQIQDDTFTSLPSPHPSPSLPRQPSSPAHSPSTTHNTSSVQQWSLYTTNTARQGKGSAPMIPPRSVESLGLRKCQCMLVGISVSVC